MPDHEYAKESDLTDEDVAGEDGTPNWTPIVAYPRFNDAGLIVDENCKFKLSKKAARERKKDYGWSWQHCGGEGFRVPEDPMNLYAYHTGHGHISEVFRHKKQPKGCDDCKTQMDVGKLPDDWREDSFWYIGGTAYRPGRGEKPPAPPEYAPVFSAPILAITEGQSDADAVLDFYGIPAITHCYAANGPTKEQQERFRDFKGEVYLFADRDANLTGLKAAEKTIQGIANLGARKRFVPRERITVYLPPNGYKDIREYLEDSDFTPEHPMQEQSERATLAELESIPATKIRSYIEAEKRKKREREFMDAATEEDQSEATEKGGSYGRQGFLDNTRACPDTWDDKGNARLFIRAHGPNLRYVADLDRWIVWSEAERRWLYELPGNPKVRELWLELTDRMNRYFRHKYLPILKDSDSEKYERDEASSFASHMTASANVGRAKACIEMAECSPDIAVAMNDLNRETNLLQCSNGVVNLDTGKLVEGSRELMHTHSTGIQYVEGKRSEPFNLLLKKMFPDEDARDWFLGLLRYMLYRGNPARIVIILQGPTGSGKSTVVTLLLKALGDYSTVGNHTIFHGQAGDKSRPDLFRVLPYRVVTIDETSDAVNIHADQMKKLSSGSGQIATRTHQQEEMLFDPAMTVLLQANQTPNISGADKATFKRLRMVATADCNLSEEDVKPLYDGGEEVLEGVLATIIEAPKLDFTDFNDVPASMRDYQEQMQEEMTGDLAAWIREGCAVGPDYFDAVSTLYECFTGWLRDGQTFITLPEKYRDVYKFGRELGKLGYETKQKKIGGKNTKVKVGLKVVSRA